MSARDKDVFMTAAPIQRTVDAATAPRVQTTAPNSPFNWRPAGENAADGAAPTHSPDPVRRTAPTPTATVTGLNWGAGGKAPTTPEPESTEETSTMPRDIKAPTPTAPKGASARFQICALLLAKGDLKRDEILADVSADKNAIYQAFHSAKKAEHIRHIASTDKWSLTTAGREWTCGGANLDNQRARKAQLVRAAAPAAAKPQRKAKRVPVADIVVSEKPPTPPSMPRSFRCAVYSDGGFMLHKGDARIELDADEHAGMLRYLERMAEEQATA
jgi:hypothetical protein